MEMSASLRDANFPTPTIASSNDLSALNRRSLLSRYAVFPTVILIFSSLATSQLAIMGANDLGITSPTSLRKIINDESADDCLGCKIVGEPSDFQSELDI
jgi:hypothetical protein